MKKLILLLGVLLFLISCSDKISSDEELEKISKELQEKYSIESLSEGKINWEKYCSDYKEVIKYQESYISEEIIREVLNSSYSLKQGNCIYSTKTIFYTRDEGEYSPIIPLIITYKIEDFEGDIIFEETCNNNDLDECSTFLKYQDIKFNELIKNN